MLFASVLFASWAAAANANSPVTNSPVDALLASMTLEEKIGQMVQIDISKFMKPGTDEVDYDLMRQWVNDYKIGSILNSPFSGGAINGVSGWTAAQYRELIVNMQMIAESSGSKLPIIYGIDSIHGATFVKDAALFPQAIAVAATFDTSMAYKSAQISSRDTRAAGIQWLFAPVLGLGLHPLWARFPETFGEDPYLAAQMGKAVIDGIQYHDGDATIGVAARAQEKSLRANKQRTNNTEGVPARAAACMKHFIAYSYPVNGHDRSPVLLPDRMVRQLYMPSFQAAIDTGVMTAMESYQEVGGEPMVSSKKHLKTLLRKEMKFKGMMVTDYMEIENLHNWHKIAASQSDAVQISMTETTVDMSMVPLDSSFGEYLGNLVKSGVIDESRVDDSARRVLQLKHDLGMFEPGNRVFAFHDTMIDEVGNDADWQVSLDTSRAAITLLKNEQVNAAPVLPMAPGAKVFVTGPTADSVPSITGGWSIHWQGPLSNGEVPQGVTILQGIRDNGLFTGPVTYYPGVSLNAQDTSAVDTAQVQQLASEADYIVVCVGEGTYAEKPGDIDDLALPQGQVEYVQLLASYGKPVVLVTVAGRPRLMHDAVSAATAVINAYVPGPKGGLAVAEVLSGAIVPSGRLPYNYPRNAGDIPYAYHHKPGDQCVDKATGAYITCQMEWEFGTGLSYTSFEYSNLALSSSSISEQGQVTVSLTVKNTGDRYTATDSVLLFLFDVYRRVTPEYKLLKRFSKVTLAPGAEAQLQWTLNREDLKYVGLDSRYILESGEFRVGAGAGADCRADSWSSNPLCAAFTLDLTSDYQPVCDYACSMWAPESADTHIQEGVCGNTVEAASCRSTCVAQAWTWNYVDCIEQYYQENTCPDAAHMMCFDAFNMAPPSSSTNTNDAKNALGETAETDCDSTTEKLFAKPWFIGTIVAVASVVSLVAGALLSSWFHSRRVYKDKLSALVDTNGIDRAFLLDELNTY